MSFDANAYWLWRGKGYKDEPRLMTKFYLEQAEFLSNIVKSLRPGRILELGCGFGRVTKLVGEKLPFTHILGLDLSPDQVAAAWDYCSGLSNVEFAQADITGELPTGFDLVMASELFLHIHGSQIERVILSAFKSAPVLVHDCDKESRVELGQHVFYHDYDAIYNAMGVEGKLWHHATWDQNFIEARRPC